MNNGTPTNPITDFLTASGCTQVASAQTTTSPDGRTITMDGDTWVGDGFKVTLGQTKIKR